MNLVAVSLTNETDNMLGTLFFGTFNQEHSLVAVLFVCETDNMGDSLVENANRENVQADILKSKLYSVHCTPV